MHHPGRPIGQEMGTAVPKSAHVKLRHIISVASIEITNLPQRALAIMVRNLAGMHHVSVSMVTEVQRCVCCLASWSRILAKISFSKLA